MLITGFQSQICLFCNPYLAIRRPLNANQRIRSAPVSSHREAHQSEKSLRKLPVDAEFHWLQGIEARNP